jgi:predicted SAM-dependent methyltransferase
VKCEIIVGLDAYLPYLKSLRRQGIYNEVILANATALPFKEHSFDTVLAAEVIEHLSIKEGLKLIDECE